VDQATQPLSARAQALLGWVKARIRPSCQGVKEIPFLFARFIESNSTSKIHIYWNIASKFIKSVLLDS
jgi:hypothetical protein